MYRTRSLPVRQHVKHKIPLLGVSGVSGAYLGHTSADTLWGISVVGIEVLPPVVVAKLAACSRRRHRRSRRSDTVEPTSCQRRSRGIFIKHGHDIM